MIWSNQAGSGQNQVKLNRWYHDVGDIVLAVMDPSEPAEGSDPSEPAERLEPPEPAERLDPLEPAGPPTLFMGIF